MSRWRREKKKFASEVELAQTVCTWAEQHGWEVFKEVATSDGGDIDIVLKQQEVLWAIECKMLLNTKVMEQAYQRLLHVHYVSIAVPERVGDLSWVYEEFLKNHGIGLIEVKHPDECRYRVHRQKLEGGGHRSTWNEVPEVNWHYVAREEVEPKIWRPHDLSGRVKQNHYRIKKIKALKASLSEKHKTLIAGAPGGGQWTPFKETTENVKTYLRQVGSATLEQIVTNVEHHYRGKSSAKAGLFRMMDSIYKKDFKKAYANKEVVWSLNE